MAARILILDDDLSTLEMLRLALEGEGDYHVLVASTLVDDLVEIEQIHPDVIVLDYKFGGRELGWDYVERLKGNSGTREIPIIFCTGAVSDVHKQEGLLQQKGIPVLYKPFRLEELLELIQKCLATSTAGSASHFTPAGSLPSEQDEKYKGEPA
ncbi:MAG TPA: response regulator [Ktedonobacteraceae bacterium]|nr:response regulator [Ktedonobacteraceae bacterium]